MTKRNTRERELPFRYAVRDNLDRFIYDPAVKKLKRKLEDIMVLHGNDDPHGAMAFMYKGCLYSPKNYKPTHRITLLKHHHYAQMDEWLVQERELLHERLAVSNYLSCLLMECTTTQDIKNLLPDCLLNAFINSPEYLSLAYGESNSISTLQPETIYLFNQLHQGSIQLLKERLVWNMLM